MAYRFDSEDKDLQAGLRRIANEELSAALTRAEARGSVSATAIHDIRKHVKKLRGLLRLLRPGFSRFEAENAALRAAGQSLSSLRDSEVRLATFDRLLARARLVHLAPLRARLVAERDEVSATPGHMDEALSTLTSLRDRAAEWRLKGSDRKLLIAGLSETRRAGRKAMAAAVPRREIEAMHDWRKRVKDHWYQARLLTPVWPAVMGPLADLAGVLGEDLGDHHDLAVLADYLAALSADEIDPALASEAITLARAGQTEIEAKAFPLGAHILAGKPQAVATLWADWWRVWRG